MGEARRVLRFGAFDLDLEARQLRRSGIPVHLTRQAFSVLGLLVTGAGRVITRGELRRALWADGTHVEFERGINFCINQVRVALRDDARAPRFVETLPRVGYRFVAEVGSLEPPPVSAHKVQPARSRHLALAIALALAAVSGVGSRRSVDAGSPPVGRAALDAYLRGRLLAQRGGAALEEAVDSFEHAVTLAPRHAPAQAALAHALLSLSEAGLRPARQAMPRARGAALAALSEDPALAQAWLSLAAVRLYYEWDWGAQGDIDRALSLQPGAANAHNARAALLSARGQHADAIAEGERAAALDPLCAAVRGDLGWYYYCARRFPEAAEQWRRSVAIVGGDGPRDRVVDALRQLGRTEAAWREARETMLHVGVAAERADALERRGPAAALHGFLAGSVRHGPIRHAPPERLAALTAAVGDSRLALDLLERAASERSPGLVRSLAVDPDFDSLRTEPAYQRLLRQIGLS